MSDSSLSKQLSALNGQLIGQVYLDKGISGEHWCYDILVRVADDYDNADGRRESLIGGQRYVVLVSKAGYKERPFAMQYCILKIGELIYEAKKRQLP